MSQISELGVLVKFLLQTVSVLLMSRPPNDVFSVLPALTLPALSHPSTVLLVVHLHMQYEHFHIAFDGFSMEIY